MSTFLATWCGVQFRKHCGTNTQKNALAGHKALERPPPLPLCLQSTYRMPNIFYQMVTPVTSQLPPHYDLCLIHMILQNSPLIVPESVARDRACHGSRQYSRKAADGYASKIPSLPILTIHNGWPKQRQEGRQGSYT